MHYAIKFPALQVASVKSASIRIESLQEVQSMHPTIHIWGTPGNYQTYCRALLLIGGIPCVCKSLAPLCSALLLPGGGDLEPWRYGQKNTSSRGLEPERDCAEFELIARYLNLRRPILGICRGMQVLNVFFGGTLLQDLPGHSQIQGQDRFHFVQTFPSAFAQLYPPLSIVNSAHHQAVDRPGSGLEIVQSALDGVPEAIAHRQHCVWGVQWHPERLGPNGIRLLHTFLSRCTENKKFFP